MRCSSVADNSLRYFLSKSFLCLLYTSDIGIPWIKPDVLEYLREQKQHPEHYIFIPISFISEHIEVLFDNDVECYDLCQKIGVTYHRPPMPLSLIHIFKEITDKILPLGVHHVTICNYIGCLIQVRAAVTG